MNIKNIVFDTRGDMIAFVNDAVGIHCINAGIDVEFGVDINLLLDFIKKQ